MGMSTSGLGTVSERVRTYWDVDAATYDRSPGHHPRTALELATWAAALRRLLPPPPARVLDVGAGTGFLAILLARNGYLVSALDLSEGMLGRLKAKADDAGLEVQTIHADASETPLERFDAVVSRHLLWTLPAPKATLEAWHRSAPHGRLVLMESLWGDAGGYPGQLRRAGHDAAETAAASGARPSCRVRSGSAGQLPPGRWGHCGPACLPGGIDILGRGASGKVARCRLVHPPSPPVAGRPVDRSAASLRRGGRLRRMVSTGRRQVGI